jgi:DNA-binding transcriptional ArsR family regulator
MEPFTALADPTRRQIIEMLGHGELSAGDIARRFDMTAPAVSQHLKTLKAARLVTVRAEAQRRIYTLNSDGLAAIEDWIASIRRFWNPKLDALETELIKASTKDTRK